MSVFVGRFAALSGVACDNFAGDNANADQFFLSHCHSDHMLGLKRLAEILCRKNAVRVNHRIYCSSLSKVFIVRKLAPILDERFVKDIFVDEPVLIDVFDRAKAEMYKLRVTAVDAKHCPGSLMFLFEKISDVNDDFSVTHRILYTGDFRFDSLELSTMRSLHNRNTPLELDELYLDTTFCSKTYSRFPTRESALASIWDLVSGWIRKNGVYRHQKAKHVVLFHLSAQYGSESILRHVYERSGANWLVHVSDKAFQDYLCHDELSDCVHSDPKVAQWIHACSFSTKQRRQFSSAQSTETGSGSSRYYGRDLPCQKGDYEVCQIKPSAMYFTKETLDELEGKAHKCVGTNSYRVCYSAHSSLEELLHFVAHFRPKKIVPCVIPPNSSVSEVMELLEPYISAHSPDSTCVSNLVISETSGVSGHKRRSQTLLSSNTDSSPIVKKCSKTSPSSNSSILIRASKTNRSMPSRTLEENIRGNGSRRASLPHSMKIPAITITPSSPGPDPNHPDYPEFYEDRMYIESKKSSHSSTDSHDTSALVQMEVEEYDNKITTSAEQMEESTSNVKDEENINNDDDDTPEFAAIVATASTSEEKRNCDNFAKANRIVIPFDLQ